MALGAGFGVSGDDQEPSGSRCGEGTTAVAALGQSQATDPGPTREVLSSREAVRGASGNASGSGMGQSGPATSGPATSGPATSGSGNSGSWPSGTSSPGARGSDVMRFSSASGPSAIPGTAGPFPGRAAGVGWCAWRNQAAGARSEEHTSELQSRQYLVCRLLLEKKK